MGPQPQGRVLGFGLTIELDPLLSWIPAHAGGADRHRLSTAAFDQDRPFKLNDLAIVEHRAQWSAEAVEELALLVDLALDPAGQRHTA